MNTAAGAPQPFPWAAVLHTGLCLLRMPPNTFWTMTPREFFAAAGGLKPRGDAPTRTDLAGLMAHFPDEEHVDG